MSEKLPEGLDQGTGRVSGVLRTRRQFLVGLAAAMGAGWVGALLHRLFLAEPRGVHPTELPLAQLPAGGFQTVSYAGQPVMVRRSEDGTIEAISLVCTHLGCTVEWKADEGQFYCPCHEGKFDAAGRAISGPPKLPLERLKVGLEGDRVVIGERL
ncbi:MAG: ubiquinol-cytochrome c reductase iron-sulfur subunit [Chloroflexi bacterium]|nr:ubiquinol-cytochrome c reductase iron-sulfur subunit [Chloroflexota bacterium]